MQLSLTCPRRRKYSGNLLTNAPFHWYAIHCRIQKLRRNQVKTHAQECVNIQTSLAIGPNFVREPSMFCEPLVEQLSTRPPPHATDMGCHIRTGGLLREI